jgi:hypothetical protein
MFTIRSDGLGSVSFSLVQPKGISVEHAEFALAWRISSLSMEILLRKPFFCRIVKLETTVACSWVCAAFFFCTLRQDRRAKLLSVYVTRLSRACYRAAPLRTRPRTGTGLPKKTKLLNFEFYILPTYKYFGKNTPPNF